MDDNTHEIDSLMLEAKKAILEEQHARFQALQAAGMWQGAMKQLQVTLVCAADLLKDSVALLEKTIDRRKSQLSDFDTDGQSPKDNTPS